MKKGTEGYVLIYVVVVVVLLGLASAAVCSFALSGVRAQSAALERDRARYKAEGLVEQAVARLLDGDVGPLKGLSDSGFSSKDAARDAMAAEYQARIAALSDGEDPWIDGLTVVLGAPVWDREDENVCVFPVTLTAAVDGQRVEAVADQKVRISVTDYSVEVPAGPDDPAEEPKYETRYKYTGFSAGLTYSSYQIQAAEPEGGGA